MANKTIKATAKLFLDTKNAQSDAAKFVSDLKQKLSSIETAADKFTVFKDVVDYIGQIDSALSALKSKNANVFNQMFDGLDSGLRKQLEGLFGVSGSQLNQIDILREKLNTLTPKSSIKEIRNFAQEINNLFTSVGRDIPFDDINMDFVGRTKPEDIDRLSDALANFATVWDTVVRNVGQGFGGNGAAGITGGALSAEVQAEVDKLQKQITQLNKLKKDLTTTLDNKRAFDDGEDLKLTIAATEENVKKLMDQYIKLDEASANLAEGSSKYNANLAERARIGLQLAAIRESGAVSMPENVKHLIDNDEFMAVLDEFEANVKKVRKSIDAEISKIQVKIEETMANASTQTHSMGSFDGMIQDVVEVGDKFVTTTEYINGMTLALKEMFNIMSQPSTIEFTALVDGQKIDAWAAEAGEVSLKTKAESYLTNLSKVTGVSVHSHQGLGANFNYSDISSAMKQHYSGLTDLTAIVGKEDIVTLDLTKVKAEDAYKALKKLKELSDKSKTGSLKDNQISKVFSEINPDYIDVVQRWNPEQFGSLAQKIFDVQQQTTQTIEPLERFKNLITYIAGDQKIDFSKYKELFESFSIDDASNIFNHIMKAEGIKEDGQILQVGDILPGSLDSVSKNIQEQKESFIDLRREAKLTYSDIQKEVNEYLSTGKNTEFFEKFYHPQEIGDVYGSFNDLTDGLLDVNMLTNKIASDFYIDPDSFVKSAAQIEEPINKAKSALQEFFALTEEIKNKSFPFGDAEGNVEIGKYTERLNTARDALIEVAQAGELTAEDLKKTEAAFQEAQERLSSYTTYYDGYGNGYGSGEYSYTYEDEYLNVKGENERLRNDLELTEKQYQDAKEDNERLRQEIKEQQMAQKTDGRPYDSTLIDDEIDDINRENGALEDKLELLLEISQQYGSLITQKKRDRYEELNQKDMNDGLSSREEERMSELFDEIVEADEALEEFGNIYDKITLKLANGKQVDILPDDDGLRKLYKFFDQTSGDDYGGVEIEDIIFKRKQEQEIIKQNNQELQEQLNLQNQINTKQKQESNVDAHISEVDEYKAETTAIEQRNAALKEGNVLKAQEDTDVRGNIADTVVSVGTDAGKEDIVAEIQQLELLKATLLEVEQAVQAKTQAFQNEGFVVEQTVAKEIAALKELVVALAYIKSAIEVIDDSFIGKNTIPVLPENIEADADVVLSGDVSQDSYALETTLQTTNVILGNILSTLSGESSLSQLAGELSNAVIGLKDVANGIIQHQRAQRTDLTDSSVRIANNYGQLSSIVGNATSGLGNEYQIESMKALADNVVRVKGAVQDAEGVWKGFVVDIDESNNAVVRAIDEQSAFAKSLNEVSEAAKKVSNTSKETGPEDKFSQSLSSAKSVFNEYRDSIDNINGVSDELKIKLNDLGTTLQTISSGNELENWQKQFDNIVNEITIANKLWKENKNELASQIKGNVKSQFGTLDFKYTDTNLTADQQKIVDLRNQLNNQLVEYELRVKNGQDADLAAAQATKVALDQEIKLYKERNNIVNAGGKANKGVYGATTMNRITGKYNAILNEVTGSEELKNASVVQNKLTQYAAAYQKLIDIQSKFKVGESLTQDQKNEFDDAREACNKYGKEVEKLLNTYSKAKGNSSVHSLLGDDFIDTDSGRAAALKQFVEDTYGANAKIGEFKDNFNKLIYTVDNGDGTFTQMTAAINNTRTAIDATAGSTKEAVGVFASLFNEIKGKFRTIGTYLTASLGWQEIWQQIRKGVGYVKEIDTALTELKKVTDETDASYEKFLNTASKTASTIGTNVADFTNATADFARLGYDIEQAASLAEAASVYKNVGDGIENISTASESIISTMKAYGIEAENAMTIVDRFNEVGNNFAISSTGIGEAMQRSASALYEAGNTIDESIALITGANSVIQNPEQVGTALKTLALRLRGAKVELEEAGEDVDGMAESTSQLQAKLKALTHGKVDIMIDADTFKNTTEILREMSYAWQDMTDIERASALELMGGKRQANILSSLIANFDTVEDVIQTSMSSAGSALKENETYLDSIQGKMDQFTNSLQTMWMNFISSDVIKFIVEVGTSLIKIVDNIGLIKTAIIGLIGYLTVIKKKDFDWVSALANKKITKSTGGIQLLAGDDLAAEINNLNNAIKEGPTAFNNYKNAQQNLNNGMYQMIQTTDKAEYTTQDYTQALKNLDPAAQQAALKQNLLNTAIGVGMMAVVGAISSITSYISNMKTLQEEYDDLQSSISSTKSEIESLDSNIVTLEEQIDALSSKKLTVAEAEELNKLKEQSAELQRQKEIQENILEVREKQNQEKSLAMINNMLKTSAANQQKAAESGQAWGKAIGGVLGALTGVAVGAGITFLTGGLGTGAGVTAGTAVGTSIAGGISSALTMGLGTIFSGLGETAGEKIGSSLNSSLYKTDGSLIEWYESYTDAINKAEQEAYDAETKYINDVSDTNYDNWQKKVEAVNTLQTEMYDGLQELQGYIDNLEYNDQTASVIDEYNNLMTHISVTSMDGDINAQIQSLEALKSEYAELSKGVDENGNNIALSAQEYARYQAIVAQLLGYNTGLTQTFDENGNAILSANGNLVSYNSALETTIELLKQQQQLAAKNAVGLGDEGNSTFTNAYDNIIKKHKKDISDMDITESYSQYLQENGLGIKWGTRDTVEEISQVIGVDFNYVFTHPGKYIKNNIDEIKQHRSEIADQVKDAMLEDGYDSAVVDEYINQMNGWFDSIVGETAVASENAKAELKNLLYIVPQASDSYYNGDLSGNSLNFINDYIDTYVEGIENVEDLTDEQKTAIRDNILSLTDVIGSNEGLQEAIDELFTLDSSAMSIADFENEIKNRLSTIFSDDAISGLLEEAGVTESALLETLIPNQEQIDKMITSVTSKFKDGVGNLKQALTQEELEIVFRATVDMADGSMTIDDFKNVLADSFAGISGPIVQTSSAMQAEIESFNDVITQTGEILVDNTEVTQEYKDALVALGVSEEELGEYFYDDNKLVVKNADGLKKLVAQTTKLSKAQSQLQYYNLVKQLSSSLSGVKNLTSAEIAETSALIEQISKLQQTIYQYQLLEDTLLGTSNAFKKFAEAQEIDAQNTYGDDFVSMVQTMYDAFELTGQVGTEAFWASVEALVPDSVYKSLQSDADKMTAIYDYFNSKVLPSLTLDEDTVSFEYGNIEDFVNKGINSGVFEGNTEKFDLVEGMNLEKAAELMGMTKTQAYAMFAELDKYNVAGQSENSFLSQLDDSTAGKITNITSEMQRLNEEKLALLSSEGGYEANKERINEINNELQQCQTNLGVIADGVRKTWSEYSNNEAALEGLNKIEDKQQKLTEEDANKLGVEWDEVKGMTVQEAIDKLTEKKLELGEPTPIELQVALDDVESDLATAQEALKTLEEGGTIDVDLNGDGAIDDANTLKGIIEGLENEKASITLALQTEDGADIGDKIDEIVRQLSIISGVEPTTKLSVDNTDANTKIDETKSAVDELDNKTPEVNAKANTTDADNKIENTSEQVNALDEQTAKPSVEIKDEGTQEKLSEIDSEIEKLNQRKVEIYNDPSGLQGATAELTWIEGKLYVLNNQRAKIVAETETESAKQELNEVEQTADNLSAEPVTVTVLAEADTALLLDKLKDFQSTYETLKTTIEIGADTTAAKANFQAAVSALNQESPEVLAKLGIDMTSSSAEINAVISSLTPEIMVNCGLNKTAVDEFVGVEHTATGIVTWNNNHTAIDEYIEEEKTTEGTVIWDNDTSAVDSWMSQNLEVDGTVNWYNNTSNVKTSFTATGTVTWSDSEVNGTANASGTAHVNGTAFKGGSWGAPRTETALVGELGPEMLVRDGRWTTIGEGGAEFTQIKKGDIIFNHKQTEQLLSQGHITGRGKAYASGTAYAGLWGPSGGSSSGSSSSSSSDSSSSSSSSDSSSDAADEFEETLDWIEILLEEINEQIDLMSAKIENTAKLINKNNLIDDLIDIDKNKMAKLQAGITKYANYAAKLLSEVPASYRKSAQDGAIAIEEFVGEADEKTVEAIRNYREWAQKVADLKQQLEETKTEIADLAKQKFDNISDRFGKKISIFDRTIEQFEGLNDTAEAMGLPAAEAFYKQMITYSKKRQDALVEEQWRLQDVLDREVELGNIQVYDDRWYEMVEELYEVDIAIQECVVDMEEYQNAINEIYWDNLDELVSRLEGVSNEAQNLIDLMDSADMVITPESDNGWTADQVEWTKEGVASLGLYAQQMETAEYTAKQYEKAINDLNKDYQKGLYSESEYIEKLNELKDAQYDSIESYYDAQDAIVDLNKTRVDSIKKGIEKEIEAYEKLIEKKKEALENEKDLYDFQKSVGEQSKNIAEIERKLAALAGDNSVSAAAKRKKLEAELAEAQYELQDTYYNRSVEDKQTALDKELENFQEEKDAEVEKWEEYLEKIETVVADSLLLVQNNATGVYDTLNEKANEYGLTLSDTVLAPWKDGVLAIDEYQNKFGQSVSSTMDQLAALKKAWQDVIDLMTQEAKVTVTNVKQSNANIAAAKKKTATTTTNKTTNTNNTNKATNSNVSKPSLTTGTYVEVKSGTKWYADSYGGGSWGYARSGKIQYINTSGSHAYNIEGLGWIRKQDIVGYAKGTTNLKKSGIVNVDELGEELIIGAQNGRLTYLEKGSGVVPADITSNLMSWGKLDPQEILDRNRPSVAPHKNVVNNTEIKLDASVGTLVNIENFDGNDPDEILKIVNKAYDKKMQELNNSIKRFAR